MHRHFTKSSIILGIVLGIITLTITAGCDEADSDNGWAPRNTDHFAEEPLSYEIDLQNQTLFRLEGINGLVQISGSANATAITISGEKRVESDSVADAEAHLADLSVEIRSEETEVVVRTDQPEHSAGRNYIVNYTVILPHDLAIDAANANGTVSVQAIAANVTVVNVNGYATTRDIAGSLSMAVVNGQIDAAASPPAGGFITLNVVNGGILLGIPQDISAMFAAIVETGVITVSNLILTDIVQTATQLSGRLGNGEGDIALETVNGNIVVIGH